jgi:hypothetical protein
MSLSAWDASIITYNMIQVRNQHNLPLPLLCCEKTQHIRLALHPYDLQNDTSCQIEFF